MSDTLLNGGNGGGEGIENPLRRLDVSMEPLNAEAVKDGADPLDAEVTSTALAQELGAIGGEETIRRAKELVTVLDDPAIKEDLEQPIGNSLALVKRLAEICPFLICSPSCLTWSSA